MGEYNASELSHYRHDRYSAMSGRHDRALRSYLRSVDEVKYNDESYDILFAVDDLLQDFYDLDNADAAVSLRESVVDLLPSDDMFNDPDTHRQAKELLLLFPLRYMSDSLSQLCTVLEAEAWFYHVGSAIIDRTSALHGSSCRDTGKSLKCRHSTQCPHRVLRTVLTTSVTQPDLAALSYDLLPETEMSFARMKMDVASQLQLVSTDECANHIKFYDYLIMAKQHHDV